MDSIKMVVIGEANVGKSSLSSFLAHGMKPNKTSPTIGAAYYSIVRGEIRLAAWDSSGSERYGSLMPMYVRGARVVMCVYDVTNPDSLERTVRDRAKYMQEIAHIDKAIWILVGNKTDLRDCMPTEFSAIQATAKSLSTEWNVQHFLVSANNGEGVEELLDYIFHAVRNSEYVVKRDDPKIIKVGAEAIADVSLFDRARSVVPDVYKPRCCNN